MLAMLATWIAERDAGKANYDQESERSSDGPYLKGLLCQSLKPSMIATAYQKSKYQTFLKNITCIVVSGYCAHLCITEMLSLQTSYTWVTEKQRDCSNRIPRGSVGAAKAVLQKVQTLGTVKTGA